MPFMIERRHASEPASVLDPTLDFLRLLWSIEHNLQSTSKRMASRLGITGPQRLVLKVVAEFPGISATEVAHLLRLHPSTITGILQRLTTKRLLLRATDPIDTRRVRLRALPAARRFTRPLPGTVEYAVGRTLKQFASDSVQTAQSLLAAIAASLEPVPE